MVACRAGFPGTPRWPSPRWRGSELCGYSRVRLELLICGIYVDIFPFFTEMENDGAISSRLVIASLSTSDLI